jgi:N-acetylmuramoyl-L-alanine amidase
MILHHILNFSFVAVLTTALTSCGGAPTRESYLGQKVKTVAHFEPSMDVGRPAMSTEQLMAQVNLQKDYIPSGRHARKYKRKMTPRYITIHSTQNYSKGADAWRHSEALKNGKLRAYKRKGGNRIGYLVWHYSIDEDRVVQHLPDNEQGEHADFDGPGNNYSLGLEMCENRGNSRSETLERTAKLTAYLMKRHRISIRNVVPHYHWPRVGNSRPHKNCPHFLLDDGRPGAKWRAFQNRVMVYYKLISVPVAPSPYSQYPQYAQR